MITTVSNLHPTPVRRQITLTTKAQRDKTESRTYPNLSPPVEVPAHVVHS